MNKEARQFHPGDKVKWTHVTSRSSWSVRLRTRVGRVVEAKGNIVLVRYNGKRISLNSSDLRPCSQPSELTEIVAALANARTPEAAV